MGDILTPVRNAANGDTPTPDGGNYSQGLTEKNSDLATGIRGGSAVVRNPSTDEYEHTPTIEAHFIVDDDGNPIRSGHIAPISGLTKGAKYFIHPKTQIESARYDENSYDMTAIGGNILRAFLYNGKWYVLNATDIYQYTYTKGDINSLSYDSKTKDVSAQMTICRGMAAAGNKVYLMNSSLDTPNYGRIIQYSWTPDDISSLSPDSIFLDVNSDTGIFSSYGLQIIGSRMYVFGFGISGITLAQYYVSDFTDISSASLEKTYIFSVSELPFDGVQSYFAISNNKFYVYSPISSNNWYISQWSIPDLTDITTMFYDYKYFDASEQIDSGNGDIIALVIDDEYMYLAGDVDGTYTPYYYQYHLEVPEAIDNISEKPSAMEAGIALDTDKLLVDIKKSCREGIKNVRTEAYTLRLEDVEYMLHCENANAQTVIIPPVADQAWPDNVCLYLAQKGAGALTIAAGSGVTIQSIGTTLAAQEAGCALYYIGSNVWQALGSLS